MKCPFTLKALRNSLLVCLLVGGVASKDACAAEAIETTFYRAETMLKKYPSQLAQFKVFKDTVHRQLRSFLDLNNKESYATHVGYMEQNARDFHANFVLKDEFKCIRSLATALHADMMALLVLLKSHIGSRSPGTLGLSLAARFEHLLPKVILKEVGGVFKLQSILEYRLDC